MSDNDAMMREDGKRSPQTSDGHNEETGRGVEDFQDFSAKLLDIFSHFNPAGFSCGACPSNEGRKVSFQDLAR